MAMTQDPSAVPAFFNQPFWTSEYVGAGPFVLRRWEPGSFLEGEAFVGHVLGRPRVDRLIMRIFPDENTVLTNVLAGEVDVVMRLALRFEHGMVLKREWVPARKGEVLFTLSTGGQYAMFQFRREYQKTPELFELPVRQALATAYDARAVNEALFEGEVPVIDTFLAPTMPAYPLVERVLSKYPYDPRRTEQLMGSVGLVKDREGYFARGGNQFRPDFRMTAGRVNEQAQAIIVDTWRAAGINAQPSVLPTAQELAEARHTFGGVANAGGVLIALRDFPSTQIASPATRWVGRNRGAWVSPEFDRLYDGFHGSLDRSERDRLLAAMLQLVSAEVPAFPLFAAPDVWVHTTQVSRLIPGTPDTQQLWNIHEWEMRL
jgi:peptide/nickel transport system substrate-binding protein